MTSTRLPGKVLRPVLGEPMLARQIERVRRVVGLDLVVATSDQASDDPVHDLCSSLGVACFRGPLDDVLARFVGAIQGYAGNPIVRLTGDCPLTDPVLIEEVVRRHGEDRSDYTSNVVERHLPDGLDVEVVEREALQTAFRESAEPADREHVTRFLRRKPSRFRVQFVRQTEEKNLASLRWTVDVEQDLCFVRRVYAALYPTNPDFGWRDVLAFSRRTSRLNAANGLEARP